MSNPESTPKLSIIVPIFNVENYISDCLDSILIQDSSEIEIIMINDGSTDKSKKIATEYIEKFQRSHLHNHDSNIGLGAARNSGIFLAKGKYILFLDSDDTLEPNAIKTLINLIAKNPLDILQFGCNKLHIERTERDLYLPPTPYLNAKLFKTKCKLLEGPNYAWMKAYRRSFLKEIGITFENIFYEDIPWNIEVLLNSGSILWINEALVNYRQRKGSIINSKSPRHHELISAYNYVFENLKQNDVDKKYIQSIRHNFIDSIYYFHKHHKTRIGTRDTEKLLKSFEQLIKKHKIRTKEPKRIAMLSIIRTYIYVQKIKSAATKVFR